MSLVYLGIDPGYTGALAFYEPARDALAIYDYPTFAHTKSDGRKKTVGNLIELARIVDENVKNRKVIVFIEAVGPRPGESPVSAFNFGFTAGALNGCMAAHFLRIEPVTPAKWKRELRVPADKDGARAAASRLLPTHAHHWPLKGHDGRAEAALIALYGAKADGAA